MRITVGQLKRIIREVVESEMGGLSGHPTVQAVVDMMGPNWEKSLGVHGKPDEEKLRAAEIWLRNTRAREAGPDRWSGRAGYGDDRTMGAIGVDPNDWRR